MDYPLHTGRPGRLQKLIVLISLIPIISATATAATGLSPVINLLLQDTAKVYPPLVQFTPLATDNNVAYPGYLESITGPAFANKITRISDRPSANIIHSAPYPKTPAWNIDGSLLMVNYRLLDGHDYHVIAENTWWDNDEKKWSARQPNIFYAMEHNYDLVNANGDIVATEAQGDGIFDHIFNKRDLQPTLANGATPAKDRMIYFSGAEYQSVLLGKYEGNIDHQDKYVVFAARKTGENFLTAIVYDIQNRQIKTQKDLTQIAWVDDIGDQILDWISVSPSGKYILINWLKDPDNPISNYRASIDQYDINLDFIRELSAQGQHGDIGVNQAGKDVYVQFEFWDRNGIWAYQLENGQETEILPEKYSGGHVSCRNYQRPGWCYLTTKHSDFREVFALKLDGSGGVNRFAQTHIDFHDAQGSVSPDGTRIIFTSNWGGATSGGMSEVFVVEVEQ